MRTMTPIDRLCIALQARIAELEAENAHLRAMSSSGFARGMIKPAPRNEWTTTPEPEDML